MNGRSRRRQLPAPEAVIRWRYVDKSLEELLLSLLLGQFSFRPRQNI